MKARTLTLLFFWDYDTQWGGDRSRSGRKSWGYREFENTERLLDLHHRYGIRACFAVVGAAAMPGERPYHDPAQIRSIHAAGHEVASHSHRHEWLPGLGPAALRETLRSSKESLEECIGAPVVSFVPPFNQPFDYPRGGSFSLSERREAGPERTDLGRLCGALHEAGYRFCRVAYRPLSLRLAERLTRRRLDRPVALETIAGITCVRLNTPGGFCIDPRSILAAPRHGGETWVFYGHPHSVGSGDGPQSIDALERLLSQVTRWQDAGLVRCALPRDLIDSRDRSLMSVSGGRSDDRNG